MAKEIRWGLVGASAIAVRSFLPALRTVGGGTAVVVGARDLGKAQKYAANNSIPEAAGSYEEVYNRDDLDAVYIAQPGINHPPLTLAAVKAGRAVLSEKPFAITVKACEDYLAQAPKDALAWEAFVLAFHPQTHLVKNLTKDLGAIKSINSVFTYPNDNPDDLRWVDGIGGGALLDIGCYSVRWAYALLEEKPEVIKAEAKMAPTGVDESGSATLQYPSGAVMNMHWSFREDEKTAAIVEFEKGTLKVPSPFHPNPGDMLEITKDGKTEKIPSPEGTSFDHGIRHIHNVLANGATPEYRIQDVSLVQAQTLEEIKNKW